MDFLSKEDIRFAYACLKGIAPERVSIEPYCKTFTHHDEFEILRFCRDDSAVYILNTSVAGYEGGGCLSEICYFLCSRYIHAGTTDSAYGLQKCFFADSLALSSSYGVELNFTIYGYKVSVI